ncbi:MAG TPA: menaquinone reductase integral membrane subunit QrcD [Thermoanaerobaculia bacterium]|nr:menaquinone reductase integral membrane subunit QrcD [Thermoanaerobaculia bacterium]
MDKALILRGVRRCSTKRFLAWLAPWGAMLALGLFAIGLCLALGLNQTNMDNRFAFGLWIFLDLAVIALGAGAFFTGFLLYILRRDELRAVINSAVVIGFICYSGAVLVLAVDVGQPLRAWFTFWHPNVHSMLTEVTFCITCYLTVLAIEYAPILLRNRQIRKVPAMLVFEMELHKVMPVFAAVGTFLSFFHQGSLGGLYGVLQGRPFAFRDSFAIWPSTFFLFILSAIATGPAFVLLTTWGVSAVTRKKLVRPEVFALLAKVSGWLLIAYVGLKSVDTLVWLNRTAPRTGANPFQFYAWQPFGTWVLFFEIVVLGLVPALIFLSPTRRRSTAWLLAGSLLACTGVAVNRFVMTIQTLAVPTLRFEPYMLYWPSWQELATFLFVVAYGVILYSLSFRYLTLFPQERELSRFGG